MRVTVVDYGNGNAHSILRALHASGIEPQFSNDRTEIAKSDFLVLPGVGHTGAALASLRSQDLVAPLEEAVFERGARVLGICLGMQIMADHVDEGGCAGLGWVRGQAVQLQVDNRIRYKVPHIGWNSVSAAAGSRLFPADGDDPFFYFCHKYTVVGIDDVDRLSTFHYETDRIAAFEKGNIFGVQFHPEKSQAAGRALFQRFFHKD